MAESRKPDYFFTPDEMGAEESYLEVSGEVVTTENEPRAMDFEEAQVHWRPGDTLEW
jgi:hypothetical protein